jgi:hypothetical protein
VGLAIVAATAVGVMAGGTRVSAAGAKKEIEPQADKMLKQMADYLAKLRSFKVRSSSVDEVVTNEGQKLQFVSSSDVSIERPNRMKSEQVGAKNGLGFWYDGKTMTVACRSDWTYATAPAPATIDQTIDNVREKFQIEAPGADLLYSKPYEILTEQVTSGRFIGRETIDGVPANHLAFVGEDVDWQIWIKEGDEPLPVRFVITSKKVKGSPEFVVTLSQWQTKGAEGASTFAFTAPAGANKVDAFPTACSAEAKR